MKRLIRRKNLIALALVAVLGLAFSLKITSYASLGNCIGSNYDFHSGSGNAYVTVHLDQSYNKGYFRAALTGGQNYTFTKVEIIFPNGREYDMGFIQDDKRTNYYYFPGTLPAGDYKFRFITVDTSYQGYMGFIYSYY